MGRKSWREDLRTKEVAELSLATVEKALNADDISLLEKARIASPFALKAFPINPDVQINVVNVITRKIGELDERRLSSLIGYFEARALQKESITDHSAIEALDHPEGRPVDSSQAQQSANATPQPDRETPA